MSEYESSSNTVNDIVKSRLKTIFALAMNEEQEENYKKLAEEEKELFNRLKMLYDSFLTNATQAR
jgi:hypothetical protein